MFTKIGRSAALTLASLMTIVMVALSSPAWVSAAGMSITPSSGDSNTLFSINATGFDANEVVSISFAVPGGQTIAFGNWNANSAGTAQVVGRVPHAYVPGKYVVSARGMHTGRTASATLTVTAVVSPYTDWKGEYYNNETLSDSPVLVRNDTAINFDWGTGSPDPSVPSDHFSARWTRDQYLQAGTYTFWATTDDGMRVWVGDTLLIDAWQNQPATTYAAGITLGAGTYPLRVEYYDHVGFAVAKVSWSNTGQGVWSGSYYANMTLSGDPVLTRQDAALDFDWGGSSPGSGVPGTNWSAKWDSTQYASSSGNYTVSVQADDGVRVWVDGSLVIDEWHDSPGNQYSATIYLGAGGHSVHVEYYQHSGGSVLRVHLTGS